MHDDEGLAAALKASEILFGAEIENLSDRQLGEVFADVPSKQLPRRLLDEPGLAVVDALLEAGLVKSKGEARRAIGEGGGYVNNRRVASVDARLTAAHLASESIIVLRRGKKNYGLLRFVE